MKQTQNYNTELVTTKSEQECARVSLEDEARNAFYFVSPDLCYLVNIRNEPMRNGPSVSWASSVQGSGNDYPCHPSNANDRLVSFADIPFSAFVKLRINVFSIY